MWANFKNVYMELGQVLNTNIIHLNFMVTAAAHNAVQKIFTRLKVVDSILIKLYGEVENPINI